MNISKYIDEAKRESGVKSYNELAKKIGIRGSSLSNIRNGGTASEKTILKIAELAKRDPIKVISNYKIERAKSTAEAEFWRSLLRQAAGVILAVTALGFLTVEESEASKIDEKHFTSYTLCAIGWIKIKNGMSTLWQSLLDIEENRKTRVFA